MPCAEFSLEHLRRTIDAQLHAVGRSAFQQNVQTAPFGHCSRVVAQALPKAIHTKEDGDPTARGCRQFFQETNAVVVVLDEIRADLEKAPSTPDHGHAHVPLALPVPQRNKGFRQPGAHRPNAPGHGRFRDGLNDLPAQNSTSWRNEAGSVKQKRLLAAAHVAN